MRRLEYIEENEHTMNKGNLPQGEDPKEDEDKQEGARGKARGSP